jgi:hypothetical protein
VRANFSDITAVRNTVSFPRTIRPAVFRTAMSPARSTLTVSIANSCLCYVYRRGEVPNVIKTYVKILLTVPELQARC